MVDNIENSPLKDHPLNRESPGIHHLMPATQQRYRQQPVFQPSKRDRTGTITLPGGEILKIDLDRGVKWSKAKQKWCAKTMYDGKKWTLGYFIDKRYANNSYMSAIKAKRLGHIKEHLEEVGARVTVGSRGPSKKPKQEFESFAPVLSKELSFKQNQQRPAYSLGGVTHKKRRGRPRKHLKNPAELWKPIRPRPMHPSNRANTRFSQARAQWSPYPGRSTPGSPVKMEPDWDSPVKRGRTDAYRRESFPKPLKPLPRLSMGPDVTIKKEPDWAGNGNASVRDVANILVGMKRAG